MRIYRKCERDTNSNFKIYIKFWNQIWTIILYADVQICIIFVMASYACDGIAIGRAMILFFIPESFQTSLLNSRTGRNKFEGLCCTQNPVLNAIFKGFRFKYNSIRFSTVNSMLCIQDLKFFLTKHGNVSWNQTTGSFIPPPPIFFLDWYKRKGPKCRRHKNTAPGDHWERRLRVKLEIAAL